MVKNSPVNIGGTDSIHGSGRSHGRGNGSPLQYSCLGNPTGKGTWWATVHGVTKNQIKFSNLTHIHKINN